MTHTPVSQGDKQTMDFLHLRARMVRYIHLPGTLDPAAAIEAHRRAAAEALATHRRHVSTYWRCRYSVVVLKCHHRLTSTHSLCTASCSCTLFTDVR